MHYYERLKHETDEDTRKEIIDNTWIGKYSPYIIIFAFLAVLICCSIIIIYAWNI